jgi:hypothetical protein
MSLTQPLAAAENRRRSKRVILELPVIVVTKDQNRVVQREATHTLVVNAHGGLMHLEMPVVAGQMIVLVNPRSGQEEGARVVRTGTLPTEKTAVAFEFNRPAPTFWPVSFPPADWNLAPE